MAPSPVLPNGGGFSSPTTPPPPSSYRELDDAFLQSQTRIWLGEVLNMRLDKDINISDLLADGQILFGVYKLFRQMLISEDLLSNQKFLERESVSSSEITEIFPYVKVERFLEVCKRLGLSDIDLFTTSDVVHKRNTRKVCMCLRSLSKKARSRNLHIPDFDSVTHRKKSPVTMPTNMVGNRRRNLERSSSSSVHGSDDLSKDSRRSEQGEFAGLHADIISYKADGEDECNSGSVVGDSLEGSADCSANSTSPRTSDPSTVPDFSFVQCELEQLNITSPSQSLGSGVGDNFQLIDHQSNHDHGNHLPNHSPNPIPVDWQSALEEESSGNNVVKSDDTTDNEMETNGDDGYSHIQLADAENADPLQSSTVGSEGALSSNEIEPDHSLHNLCNEVEVVSTNDVEAVEESVTSPHPVEVVMDKFDISHESEKYSHIAVGSGVNQNCENCRDIPCIEDMKKMHNSSNTHSVKGEVIPKGGLVNCDEANSTCHAGINDFSCIEDADKDETEDLKDEYKIAQPSKPPRKMLKLIAGGTGTVAAAGILLFWLQLRKPPRFYTFFTKPPLFIIFFRKLPELLVSSNTTPKTRKKETGNVAAPKFSLPNPTRIATTETREKPERAAATNKIYPANKLNF